jgi:membrane protein DedA with SNARE-associated domain
LEELILKLQTLDPLYIYLVVFSIAFIENVFPPSPSDLVIVFAGSLVGLGRASFVFALVWATLGSTAGFFVMYKIGAWFGDRILERGRIKFIPVEGVMKVEAWFSRYGYWIIIANRFLAGTRAVVSFFAGMSELKLLRTTILCFLSALAWNAILLASGYFLGNNWARIGFYLKAYSEVITGILIIAALIFLARYVYRKNSKVKAQ